MTLARMPAATPSRKRTGDADLTAVAALVADPGRCRMLLALDQEGRELPAGRLAAEAGVSPATASAHLAKLVEGGLLSVRPRRMVARRPGCKVTYLSRVYGVSEPAEGPGSREARNQWRRRPTGLARPL